MYKFAARELTVTDPFAVYYVPRAEVCGDASGQSALRPDPRPSGRAGAWPPFVGGTETPRWTGAFALDGIRALKPVGKRRPRSRRRRR
ncbi:hypothetical protein GCM10010530_58380 [Kribbella aluminosa]